MQTQMVNALNGLLVQLMDSLSENATGTEIQVVFSWVLLSCCIVLAFCVAATMARAVAVPYTKLYHASERLTRESNEIAAHASASSKFVPYKTLELVGCYQVIDLKVGRLVLKRMIVMFGDIVSFTTLSSKMSSEEVFRYAWAPLRPPAPSHGRHSHRRMTQGSSGSIVSSRVSRTIPGITSVSPALHHHAPLPRPSLWDPPTTPVTPAHPPAYHGTQSAAPVWAVPVTIVDLPIPLGEP